MNIRDILLTLGLLCAISPTQAQETFKPIAYKHVTLGAMGLQLGERVERVTLTVTGADIQGAHVPVDWNCEISAPVSGVATLDAEAAHGIGMTCSLAPFYHFASLVVYPPARSGLLFSVRASITLFSYRGGRTFERTISVPQDKIIVEASNDPREPTA